MTKDGMHSYSSERYVSHAFSIADAADRFTSSRASRAKFYMKEGFRKPGNYPHRVNRDGTIDSICSECFLTIGTSMWEADLESLEAAHCCAMAWEEEPEERRRAQRAANGNADSDRDSLN